MTPQTELIIQLICIILMFAGWFLMFGEMKNDIKLLIMTQKKYNIYVAESSRFEAQKDLERLGLSVTENITTGPGIVKLSVKYDNITDTYKIAAIQQLHRKK